MNEAINSAKPWVSSWGSDAGVADKAEQLVLGHGVLVVA
jgi:hypothetical protein